MKTSPIYRGIWCNVVHTKESNVEAIRIIKSEPTLTIHKVPSFLLFHAMIVFFRKLNVIWIVFAGLHQKPLVGDLQHRKNVLHVF